MTAPANLKVTGVVSRTGSTQPRPCALSKELVARCRSDNSSFHNNNPTAAAPCHKPQTPSPFNSSLCASASLARNPPTAAMWLDRLAGGPATSSAPSTPQPTGRPFNPLSRRTPSSSLSPYVTAQRQGHSPRGSSLSLVSNDSTVSLLSSSRRPNGSGVPRQPSGPEPGSDPADVLQKLLKTGNGDGRTPPKHKGFITEADLELDIDFAGLSLKEVAASQDPGAAPSTARRPQTTQECSSSPAYISEVTPS